MFYRKKKETLSLSPSLLFAIDLRVEEREILPSLHTIDYSTRDPSVDYWVASTYYVSVVSVIVVHED